jgi:hypothetical protein
MSEDGVAGVGGCGVCCARFLVIQPAIFGTSMLCVLPGLDTTTSLHGRHFFCCLKELLLAPLHFPPFMLEFSIIMKLRF